MLALELAESAGIVSYNGKLNGLTATHIKHQGFKFHTHQNVPEQVIVTSPNGRKVWIVKKGIEPKKTGNKKYDAALQHAYTVLQKIYAETTQNETAKQEAKPEKPKRGKPTLDEVKKAIENALDANARRTEIKRALNHYVSSELKQKVPSNYHKEIDDEALRKIARQYNK
jgi:hypothetical protein